MNVILKGFDDSAGKPMIETAFKGLKIGTCINVMNDKKQWPELDCENQIFIPAGPQRAGDYSKIDWSEISPLDEELIEKMRACEALFMTMVERYANYKDMPYEERKRQYFDHLRYWDHMIEKHQIGLLLMNSVAHQCYDQVINDLCKLKNIPVWFFERMPILGVASMEEDFETTGTEIKEKMEEVRKRYEGSACASTSTEITSDEEATADKKDEIDLHPLFEEFCKNQMDDKDPWYMGPRDPHLETDSFIKKWGSIAVRIFIHKPKYFFRSVFSPAFWKRKIKQHKTSLMYDRIAVEPDLSKKFIYMPLHMQPEATTCPLGGVYTDQNLMVQQMASHLPPDVLLYVKEHPAQEELCRSPEFYETLKNTKQVVLVPRYFSTHELTRNALAVATVTGTACLEGLFKGKSAVMFGHQFFQYAPGVKRVHTNEDCKRAVEVITSGQQTHTLRDLRIFMKALEETTFPYAGAPETPHMSETWIERAVIVGEEMGKKVRRYF
ncbi:TPA: hypothetical protein DE059_05200 [Candidatus Peribacteria bacterium]|jgi:hypothetical protein|nr:hypothetical protein [Candidatus Peribacteria bacterium]|tara:strand:- start:2023 stop:3510 length:1488 start_codon:yes stop_codon:yes gene_type:complete